MFRDMLVVTTAGCRGDGAMGDHPVGTDVIEMLQNII